MLALVLVLRCWHFLSLHRILISRELLRAVLVRLGYDLAVSVVLGQVVSVSG